MIKMKSIFAGAVMALAAIFLSPSLAVAGPLSDYLEGKVLGNVFQNTAYTPPTTVCVALGTACSDSSFTELASTGAYARTCLTANSTNWAGPTGNNGTVSNGAAVTFTTATADWNGGSTIGYWALYDASSAGNLLVCNALTAARAVTNGAQPSFPIGSLTVQVDN